MRWGWVERESAEVEGEERGGERCTVLGIDSIHRPTFDLQHSLASSFFPLRRLEVEMGWEGAS